MNSFIRTALLSMVIVLVSMNSHAFEYLSGRSTSLGGTFILSNPTASELVELPSGLIRDGEWSVESGYHRLFELSELDQLYVAGAGRWRTISMAIGMSQFGQSDLFSEKLLKSSIAVHQGQFAFGGTLSGRIYEFGSGPEKFRAGTIGFNASYQASRILVAFLADDLTSPSPYDGSVKFKPRYSGFVEFLGRKAYSITARIMLQKEQSPQLGLGQRIRLSNKAAFYWGLSTEPVLYGGGLDISLGKGTFSYGTNVHPALGFTQTVTLSVRFGNERREGNEFD